MGAALFPSLLGAEFEKLGPPVRWVHDGESRVLRGVATVERGSSLLAKVLGALASLPPAMKDAALEVWIEPTERGERWRASCRAAGGMLFIGCSRAIATAGSGAAAPVTCPLKSG